MPTFGDTSQVTDAEQARIDSAQVGYEAYLQGLNPADRAEQERLDREAVEAAQEDDQAAQVQGSQASPQARDEADRLGIELEEVEGTGENGRVLLGDVKAHANSQDDSDQTTTGGIGADDQTNRNGEDL